MQVRIPANIPTTLLAYVLLASGCQSDRQARMGSFLNLSMAEFSARTGWVPSTYYPTAKGRAFVVDGPTVTHISPGFRGNFIQTGPTLHQFQCRLILETEAKDESGTADSWIIKAVNWRGDC